MNYRRQENTFKLHVAELDAWVYHYGWVRPPRLMQNKIKAFSANHRGKASVQLLEKQKKYEKVFDYGNLSKIPRFKGTHPACMKEWMADFHWKDQLRYSGPKKSLNPIITKHDKLKYRLVSWIEKNLLFGKRLGEFRNYILVNK